MKKEDIEFENDIYIDKQKESNNKKNDNKSEDEKKNDDKVEDNNELVRNVVSIFQNGDVQDFFRQATRQAAIQFKSVGDSLDMSFCDCQHVIKSHEQIEDGKYRCKDCPEDSNICYLFL